MALRVITGILLPTERNGTATITFNPLNVTGDATGAEMTVTGSAGDYTARPGKILSMREFRVEDKDTFVGGSEQDWFRITDDAWNENLLEVSWSCETGAMIREISFMTVGETRD